MPGFVHTLVIERPYGVDTGAAGIDEDSWGHPVRAFATLATVAGLIQPKAQREVVAANQAGAVSGDFVIYLHRRDLTTADRIVSGGSTYEVVGIRDHDFGNLAHLEVDARRIGSPELVEGS